MPESLDVAVRARAVLGEGPTWDDAAGTSQPGHPFAGWSTAPSQADGYLWQMPTTDLVTGDDGRARCAWAVRPPEYVAYHDTEWGRPVHDDVRLFEKLCLEGFQAGLSWLTILRKREAFRRAFAGFDPGTVAAFGDAEVARLLADPGIVRSRAKVAAAIANARAMVAMTDTTLDRLVWAHAPPTRPAPGSFAELPASTPESAALAAELKRRGFRFVGPTTVYATMQACGVVDDHLAGCFVRAELEGPG